MKPSRFEELLMVWQEGEASAAELHELEALLRGDPRYRRSLVSSILVEVNLYGKYAKTAGAQEGRLSVHGTSGAGLGRWTARKTRIIESLAAILVVTVSLGALSYALFRNRSEGPAHRVVSGEVWCDGAPVGSPNEDRSLEVRGTEPARLVLKDGAELRLAPGTAGVIRGRQVFELVRGGGTFTVTRGSKALRVETQAGSVSSAGGEFSVNIVRPAPAFAVTVLAGRVEVEYAGVRHELRAGDAESYALPAEHAWLGAAEYERLLPETSFGLSEAIEKAVSIAPGVPVDAKLEDDEGHIVFSVLVARDGKIRDIMLNAKTAVVIEDETENEDWSKLIAASRIRLQDAIQSALAKIPGRAVGAKYESPEGRPQARVAIFREGKIFEVVVDLVTGTVLRVSGP